MNIFSNTPCRIELCTTQFVHAAAHEVIKPSCTSWTEQKVKSRVSSRIHRFASGKPKTTLIEWVCRTISFPCPIWRSLFLQQGKLYSRRECDQSKSSYRMEALEGASAWHFVGNQTLDVDSGRTACHSSQTSDEWLRATDTSTRFAFGSISKLVVTQR